MKKHWRLWLFLIFVVLPLGGAALYTWGTLKYVYATGERSGFVQKFSKKGWVFKTWEGELAMVNLPGALPEIFKFSVRDGQVAEKISRFLGQRVVLKYDQHLGIPGTVFGETSYYASDIVPVPDASIPPPK